MTSPWDRPSIPANGAIAADEIYVHVGRALSAWEEFEIDLSWLYAALTGMPLHTQASYHAYMEKADNYNGRSRNLVKAANEYFVRHPNQQEEAQFCEIITVAKGWAARRNDIAHSVVRPVYRGYQTADGGSFDEWARRPEEYLLYPPEYAEGKFNDIGQPAYAYGVADLIHFAGIFRGLGPMANRLSLQLVERRA
jgi:hypothetical protein